jgi:hypothetical protein
MEGDKYIIGQTGLDSKSFSRDADVLMQAYWQNYGLSEAIPTDFNYKVAKSPKTQFPILLNYNEELLDNSDVFNDEQ